jgi:hypothetical protein
MAILCSYKDSDFTEVNGYRLVHAGSYSGNCVTSQNIGTTFLATQNFTFSSNTECDGVGVFARFRYQMNGEFEIQIFNATDNIIEVEKSLDLSEVVSTNQFRSDVNELFFFSFTPTTFVTGKNYQIRCRTTVASRIALNRDGTTNNWNRLIRTTTQATIGAGDTVYFHGDWDTPNTYTFRNFVMNNNNTTQYESIGVGCHAKLSWVTGNSELRLQGIINTRIDLSGTLCVYGLGEVEIGTSANPITGNARLFFNSASAGQFGIFVGVAGKLSAYGVFSGDTWTRLITDASSGASSITVDDTNYNISGWASGDLICVGGSTRGTNNFNTHTITSIAGNVLSISPNLTFAMSGTGVDACGVGNFKRNILFDAPTNVNSFYIRSFYGSLLDLNCVEFLNSSSAARPSIDIFNDLPVNAYIRKCSFRGSPTTVNRWIQLSDSGRKDDLIIEQNIHYNMFGIAIDIGASTESHGVSINSKIRKNFLCGKTGTQVHINIQNDSIDFEENFITNVNNLVNIGSTTTNTTQTANIKNNIFHYLFGVRMCPQGNKFTGKEISGNIIVCSSATGLIFQNARNSVVKNNDVISSVTGSVAISENGGRSTIDLDIIDLRAYGRTGLLSQYSVLANGTSAAGAPPNYSQVKFINSNFSFSGQAPTIADFNCSFWDSTATFDILFQNCTLTASTLIINRNFISAKSLIRFQSINADPEDVRSYSRYDAFFLDKTIFLKGKYSAKIEPDSLDFEIPSYEKRKAIRSGKQEKTSVSIKKSATYNGMQPQLWVRVTDLLGLSEDTLLATCSTGAEIWEKIEVTLPTATRDGVAEFYIKCNGTAGFINVDDWK